MRTGFNSLSPPQIGSPNLSCQAVRKAASPLFLAISGYWECILNQHTS